LTSFALDQNAANFAATAAVHGLHGAIRNLDAEHGFAAWMRAVDVVAFAASEALVV
jgi:hypothetical protein